MSSAARNIFYCNVQSLRHQVSCSYAKLLDLCKHFSTQDTNPVPTESELIDEGRYFRSITVAGREKCSVMYSFSSVVPPTEILRYLSSQPLWPVVRSQRTSHFEMYETELANVKVFKRTVQSGPIVFYGSNFVAAPHVYEDGSCLFTAFLLDDTDSDQTTQANSKLEICLMSARIHPSSVVDAAGRTVPGSQGSLIFEFDPVTVSNIFNCTLDAFFPILLRIAERCASTILEYILTAYHGYTTDAIPGVFDIGTVFKSGPNDSFPAPMTTRQALALANHRVRVALVLEAQRLIDENEKFRQRIRFLESESHRHKRTGKKPRKGSDSNMYQKLKLAAIAPSLPIYPEGSPRVFTTPVPLPIMAPDLSPSILQTVPTDLPTLDESPSINDDELLRWLTEPPEFIEEVVRGT